MGAALMVFERGVKLLATAFGLLVIFLPLLRVRAFRSRPKGRGTGKSSWLTSWPAVFMITVFYLALGILLWKPISLVISPGARWAVLLTGAALYFPGVLLYAWGFITLGRMFKVTSAMTAELYRDQQLIEEGPYAFIRHPMYLGVLLAAIGALLIFRTWAMVIFAPTAFGIILRTRREEELLAEEFGEAWIVYCARVPGWIPRRSIS
jgi:protein-S-isoprenylcysteine O-methyltransferase Ste14